MSNALFDHGRQHFANGDIDLINDDIRAVLIDTGVYTVDLANHEDYADLSGVVGSESPAFASKSTTAGVFDAADITFSSVSGNTAEALVIFQNTGVAGEDLLLAYIDEIGNFPLTPDGTDVEIVWSNGSTKIFRV